jgi:hypothetical protein
MTHIIRCASVCTVGTLLIASLACGGAPTAPSVSTNSITAPKSVSADPAAVPTTPAAAAPHTNVHGTVAGLDAVARTFVIDGQTVRVTDTTVITDTEDAPKVFADIVNGMTAHVKGPLDAGVIVAATVSIRVVVHVAQVDFNGTVTAVTGTCPDAAFTIASGTIRSDAETEFVAGGLCSEIAATSMISGRGFVQEDGSILATRIRVDAATPLPTPIHDTDFSGVVTATTGSCPARSFTIDTGIITATGTTTFPGASCEEVAVGSVISGRGALQGDGSIIASQLHLKKATTGGGGSPKTIEGAAASVTGTCPALTFTINGQAVQTTAATNFVGSGDCSLIVNGKTVEVTGEFAGGGSVALGPIVATRVKVSK